MADKTPSNTGDDPAVTPEEGAAQRGVELDSSGAPKSTQPSGTVRFTGTSSATVRIIRTNEWPEGVTPKGGKDAKDAVWDMSNGYTLSKDQFNEKQLQVLERDPNFSIK